MQHEIRIAEVGGFAKPMDEAITACVHCGFCLPACPTYQELGEEMDSPRGRIYLMKQVLEGKLDPAEAQPHIDRCLGCLACETACPSGVAYNQLISPYRATRGRDVERTWMHRLQRWLVMRTLPFPRRFRLAVRTGRWARWLRPVTPTALRPMLDLLPDALPATDRLPEVIEARGERRARVALLTGCVQQTLEPAINRATAEVLARNGVEVVVPRDQSCCGALAWHVGELRDARRTAGRLIDALPRDVDAIITNAAGCGSGIHEYPTMFEGQPQHAAASEVAQRVIDAAAFLDQLGIDPPPAIAPSQRPVRIAYHDACHLAHGQGVRSAPRRLLESIEGVELLELHDGERCCGSAGTYNLDQPEIARDLGQRKAQAIGQLSADLVATGNIGCIVQMRNHLASLDRAPRVLHTMQVLAHAYAGRLGSDDVR